MKIVATKSNNRVTSSEIDLFSDIKQTLLPETKEAIKEEVGEFLKEQILSYVGDQTSPVSGRGFAKLSKDYAKDKAADGFSPVPDLQVSGEMLDNLDYKLTSKGIEIGVYGRAAPRADGHNNLSGESKLPKRQFLPKPGEKFVSSIEKEINQIILDHISESTLVTRSDLASIHTKEEFWAFLKSSYKDMTRSEIVDTITRDPETASLLREFGLLQWLAQK